jgi:antagonist of KipI
MPTLDVVQPGLLTTVQDLGRWGWQSRGVPVSGAMDPYSHRLANALVGNAPTAATLEITLVGPHLRCADARLIAVCGAAFAVSVNGHAVPMNEPVELPPASTIRFGERQQGARAYLAVSGGIDVPPVLGSRSTYTDAAIGGHFGRALRAGDSLSLAAAHYPKRHRVIKIEWPDESGKGEVPVLRLMPGPHLQYVDRDALDVLTSGPYTIESQSNRMGFRLRGKSVRSATADALISEATVLGAVQIPSSGQPILLMADRQTTGGYPIIASVISADIGRAAQLAPGDVVSFAICSPKDAFAARMTIERCLIPIETGGNG